MKITWKHAIYITIALAIIAGVGALLWVGQKTIAGLLLLVGWGGGKKAMQHFAKATTEQAERDATIEAEAATAKEIHAETRVEDTATKAEEKAADEAEAKAVFNGATTGAELDDAVDDAVDAATRYYDKYGEDGFARAGFCLVLVLVALLGMSLVTPAPAAAPRVPTAAQKKRVAKLLNIIKRGVREHKALRRKYARDMQLAHAELRRANLLLASHKKACTDKIEALNMRRCPPTWPGALVSGGAVLLVCGLGFAVRESTR